MAIATLLLIGVQADIIPTQTIQALDSALFALPTRCVALAWQTIFDAAPDAVNITIEVSLDGVNWTVLDTSTATAGETRSISTPTAAQFVQASVESVTAGGASTVRVVIVAKVALP